VQKRIGTILLSPGVEPAQIYVFLLITCACTFVNEFAMTMQPLVFAQQLHIDPARQGFLAGLLGTTQQFGTLIFIPVAGALADIVGRRIMLVLTLTGFWLCLLGYPLITVVAALFALRFLWGVAFTGFTAGAATMAMDYPDNASRGKFISLVLIVPMAGSALLMLGGSRLPSWLRNSGYGPRGIAIGTFWIVAGIALIGAVAAWRLLSADSRTAPRGTASATFAERAGSAANPGTMFASFRGVLANLRGVFAHARENPRFAFILLIGSVVRTDSVILGAFVGLWVVNAGRLEGIDAITATRTAGLLTAIRLVTMGGGLLLFGPIADRASRVGLVLFAVALTAAGFAAFGLISDVFGTGMIAVVALVGIAEGAQSIASQSLIAQEAPAHLRGSSMGVFAFLGTASLMIVNLIGGRLFDRAGFSAPMLMESILHVAALAAALALLRARRPAARMAPRTAN
jgi:MFS family permease